MDAVGPEAGFVIEALQRRRSIGRLTAPAPSEDELRTILTAASWAPDHEELRPWRFFILEGEGMDAFGQVLADAYLARCRTANVEPTEGQLNKERTKLGRAPIVVVAGAVRTEHPGVPWIEQQMAVAAAVTNAMVAATALGFGSMWRTGDPAYDEEIKRALGLRPEDAIVGFLYLGTPQPGSVKEPHAPEGSLDGLVTIWERG